MPRLHIMTRTCKKDQERTETGLMDMLKIILGLGDGMFGDDNWLMTKDLQVSFVVVEVLILTSDPSNTELKETSPGPLSI
ncbi:hypothetical protein Dimus_024003 [Dionaea muscipula]